MRRPLRWLRADPWNPVLAVIVVCIGILLVIGDIALVVGS